MTLSVKQLEILRALADRARIEPSDADREEWSDLERRGFVKVRSSLLGGKTTEITEKGHAALDVLGGVKTVGTRPNKPK